MTEQTPNSAVEPLRRSYHGCSNIKEYELMRKLGEGTFGEVYQGERKRTGEIVALKKIIMHNEKDGFPITALREIKLLKLLSHVNIIKLEEMAIERMEGKKRAILYMVTPYMEHDLSGLLDNPDIHVTEPQRKCYMQQLLRGLMYLHNSHILHRDMKAANLLISNRGILKIADFGLARHYSGPPPEAGKGGGEGRNAYTGLVVTRWYRPPELLLNLRYYTTAIDMWGAGCVFGEMYTRKPILTGQSDLHQAQIIFELVGSPSDQTMPGWEELPGAEPIKNMQPTPGRIDKAFGNLRPEALSLLKNLLKLDWRTRINAIDALDHPYFTTPPLPARPEDIPKYKDSHELDRRNNRPAKQLPPAPEGGDVGGGANGDWGEGGNSRGGWHGGRVPYGAHDRDSHYPHHGGHRDHHGNSRIPAGAGNHHGGSRRTGWQGEGNRHNGDQNGATSRSSLPPPPGEGSRHPLPVNPIRGGQDNHSRKDTYIPSYSQGNRQRERSSERREDRRDDRREDRRDDRRDDRRGDDWHRRDRRSRDDYDYRDRDRPGDDRYRERGHDRDHRRTRSRSPEHRDRGRQNEAYRERG